MTDNLENKKGGYQALMETLTNFTAQEIDSLIERGEDADWVLQTLCLSPTLTIEQIRILLPKVKMEIYKSFLVRRPSFPTDLLYSIALENPSWFTRGFIINHPNTNDETKVILALQNGKDKDR